MNIQDISKDLLAAVSSIIEKKNVKEVDEPKAKGEKDFKDLHTKDVKVHTEKKKNVKEVDEPKAKGEKDFKDLHTKDLEVYTEKLDPKADASVWIDDFIKSDAPQFKGKSKEERKEMALAAYYSAREKVGLEEGADKEVKGDKEAYQKFFQGMLKKFGVKSPAELSGDKEKEFYDAIDAGWKADDEKKESIEEMKEPFIVIDTADDNKVVGTASNEKGAERIISSAERPPISIKDKKTLKIVKSNNKQNVGFPLKEMKSATGYEIYHKDFSSAMQHAYDFAKKKLKVEVDPKEIDREVALGPKRPSTGKTNSYRLKGKGGAIQVQVYNTGKSYELNMYKESVNEETLEERAKSMDPKKRLEIFNELKKGDKIGIAYDTPMAKADIYKDGKLVYREFTVARNKTVVGKARVEKITLAKDNVSSGVKFFLYNRNGQVSMAIGDLAAVIVDMKKM
jgi:hypothetical protein